jgi:hypothetical protein
MNNKPRDAFSYLKRLNDEPFGDLLHQALVALRLQQALRAMLPPPLAQQVEVLRLEGQRLLMNAENGAVATRLRMIAPQLLRRLQSEGQLPPTVTRIETRVNPHPTPPPPPPRRRQLPPHAATDLLALADAIGNPRLQQALRRLARHAQRRAP